MNPFLAGIHAAMTKVAARDELDTWRLLGARLSREMKRRGVEPYTGANPMKAYKSARAGQKAAVELSKSPKGRLYQRRLKTGPLARYVRDPSKMPGLFEAKRLMDTPQAEAVLKGLRGGK